MKITFRDPHHPRILITRLSAVGDCVHTMPLVRALRQQYPGAFIAWATQHVSATLLENYPGLDEVIEVQRNWLKSLGSIWRMRQRLRAFRFDVALDPQSLTKSAALGWLSGARTRVGFDKPQGREAALVLNNMRVRPVQPHVVEKYLALASPLGIVEPAVHFDIHLWQHESVDSFVREFKNGFAVINPGAGWDSKLWPAERFAVVARHLRDAHRLTSVVVWAGEREAAWAEQIVSAAHGSAVLAPPTSLPELASFMRKSRICVASDTGPLHLAAAVDTPCVGLYGPTLPSECGPYGQGHASLQAYHQDGNSRERRGSNNEALRAIKASQVQAACDQVLQRQNQSRAA